MPTITIDNCTAHYRMSKRASPDTPAAVCVHGSGADSVVWGYQVSRLSKQFRIIAPDLPGHGASEGAALESAEAYARWIDRFALALELDTFFLMGHSFGGAIVQEYSRLFPEKLKGILLIATGAGFKLSSSYRELHENGVDVERLNSDAIPASIRQGYDMLKKVSGPALHADLLAAGAFNSTAWISAIQVPALVLWGSADCITPRDLPEQLACMLPNASFHVIEHAGHVLMVEAVDAFNTAVAAFMIKISGYGK
ncbi:MAG: alpha/beta hydrolase [Deltaproteobacteria bacterium]|nr:alpha/beta hydrolase [Deltaproteobacteria bacterium]